MRKPEALHGLYVLTHEGLQDPQQLYDAVAQAIAGGAHIVQFRDKRSSTQLRLQQAQRLRELCTQTDTLFIINDDIELARVCDADGVHLGKEDDTIEDARAQLGPDSIIGISCYNELTRAQNAAQAGADYVAFGSFYSSDIKPDAVRAETDLLTRASAELDIPLVAIGGIDIDNARPLINAGADMLAVISAVFRQDDIESSAKALSDLF